MKIQVRSVNIKTNEEVLMCKRCVLGIVGCHKSKSHTKYEDRCRFIIKDAQSAKRTTNNVGSVKFKRQCWFLMKGLDFF